MLVTDPFTCHSPHQVYVRHLRAPAADLHLITSAMHARALPRRRGQWMDLVLASTPPHPPGLDRLRSLSDPPHRRLAVCLAVWLTHARTEPPPLHLLPSGQPRLPRSRNRPRIHSRAMATPRRHAHTLAAYICTALTTQPYLSSHLHQPAWISLSRETNRHSKLDRHSADDQWTSPTGRCG